MSQNKQAQRDRRRAEFDYEINKKAEKEIQGLKKDLKIMKNLLVKSKGGKK